MAPLDFDEDTAAKILRQVEFYFSDSNLPRDKFLLRTIESSDDGLVSLQVVCSFSRMRSHLGLKEHGLEAVTGDITQGVAEVLRKSALLRLSEDGLRVGRLENLERPEVVQAEVDARTVAAGPLPYDTTLEMVESFFAAFGKVNSVRLPRSPVAKVFCGSALVEFATEEEAKKLVGSKPLHEEIGLELEVEAKVAFDERMKKLYAERDARLEQEAKLERERAEAEGEVFYPQGLIVAFYLSEIGQENAEKQETGNSDANAAAEVPAEGDAAGSAPDARKAEDVGSDAAAEVAAPAPAAVEAEGVVSNSAAEGTPAARKPEGVPSDSAAEGAPAASKPEGVPSDSAAEGAPAASKSEDGDKGSGDNGLAREDIKAFMEQFGVVRFVDFTRGATSGFVRFESPEEAQKARTAAIIAEEGGLALKGFLMTVESVDGDAEKEYWKKLREGQIRRRNFAGRGDHRGRGGRDGHHSGFRGGRGGMRGGFFGKDDRQGNGYQGKRNSHKRFRDNEDGNAGNGGSKKGPAAVVFE